MAQYIGYLKGGRGQVSRLGNKNSGLSTTARGWHIGADARVYYNKDEKRDEVDVYIDGGSTGAHQHEHIGTYYRTPRGELKKV